MIPLEEFKEILGEKAKELTEEQILKLRDDQDKMAEILYVMWKEKIKNDNKNYNYHI